mmetsp:Transcript_8432/g.10658  ORF Transcript_8432/g.10658 Transcript_8432/m.10658 type:complete len:95 (+) Transcript_8432:263-547(+)
MLGSALRGAALRWRGPASRSPILNIRQRQQTRSLHKNKFCEEWNGVREDTHKTFTVDSSNAGRVVIFGIVIPAILYVWSNEEEHTRIAKELPKY